MNPPDSNSPLYLGIEIGGTKLQVVLGTADGKIHARWRAPVDAAGGAAGIRDQLQTAIPQLLGDKKPRAIGVGFGGPVNFTTGRICKSHHIPGWENFDLGQWLTAQTGLPAFIDNDANIGALAEALCGAGIDADPVFYCTLGSGVGGGLVIRKKIYHGRAPAEVEFGHLRLNCGGTLVEDRCSGWALDKRIRALNVEHPKSQLAKLSAEHAPLGGQARVLVAAVQREDAIAITLLNEWSDDLAFALSHVVLLFHPEVLVLGGGLSLLGEIARSRVANQLPMYVMQAMHPVSRVVLAALAEDCIPVGALCLAARSGMM